MAVDKNKLEAAKERLKSHPGGSNLSIISDSETARARQKLGVKKRMENKEKREFLLSMVDGLKETSQTIGDKAPKGVDVLRLCMTEALAKGDMESAAMYAEKVAQYETPKLASTQVTEITRDLTNLSDEEFEVELKKMEEDNE